MEPLITTAVLVGTTLASCALALALARLSLAAMFGLLPAGTRFVVIWGGRAAPSLPRAM
jgi:hypothetical protein